MAVSLLTQHCSKSLIEDCGGSSHTPVDKAGGVKSECFTLLILWSYGNIYILLMQDIDTLHTHKRKAHATMTQIEKKGSSVRFADDIKHWPL